jgi:maltooligosyltrehalose trehalohydrolase
MDGLRLDATHALHDDGPRHFLAELTSRARGLVPGRRTLLIAEDHRNLAHMVRPEAEGGWGLDAVWADDLHHQIRRGLAGDVDGYFRDFTGRARDLAETVRDGWFFKGQHSEHTGGPRGTDPAGLRPQHFVVCLQNHDQVGNRALGERLGHQIDLATFRAASVLLLCAPETPLLFMGQEWAAGTPFLFFTDHEPELGRLVTEGRRREFRTFAAFTDPVARQRIPDPQDPETFRSSRLDWSEPAREPHASVLRLHRALLELRRREPLLRAPGFEGFTARADGDDALVLARQDPDQGALVVLIRLRGAGAATAGEAEGGAGDQKWSVVLDTEAPSFCPDPSPVEVDFASSAPRARFARPGAVVLRTVDASSSAT